ncbi:Retrovirus-related Pol polyprotein from transposon opus, partial [Mucuna pruriens]
MKAKADSSNQTGAEFNSDNLSWQQQKVEINSVHLVPSPTQVSQLDLKPTDDIFPSPPPSVELKPLPSNLTYAYLGNDQQFLVIIANNLHQEQEEKLLQVLRRHKKAIGWKLADLPSINPSIHMHRILMEEEARPIKQQRRRLNPTILDMVKKEVTKLLAVGNIYPISDNQWVSLVQVVPKKSRMIVMKNQHDELDCIEVFMDDFTVYVESFDACLESLSRVLTRCIDTNLMLNFEKCHFMVTEGIVLGHLVSNRGIEVDKAKIDIITSLPNPASVREVRSFLGHVGFYRRFIKNFNKIVLPFVQVAIEGCGLQF